MLSTGARACEAQRLSRSLSPEGHTRAHCRCHRHHQRDGLDHRVAGAPASRDARVFTFAVVGDNGTGATPQYEVGPQMVAPRTHFRSEFVIMLGDSRRISSTRPSGHMRHFSTPACASPPRSGTTTSQPTGTIPGSTWAASGTTRRPSTCTILRARYQPDGSEAARLVSGCLTQSNRDWKIVYFHHRLYSNARRHRPGVALRVLIEPLLVENGVDVMFSGHEDVYDARRRRGADGRRARSRGTDAAPFRACVLVVSCRLRPLAWLALFWEGIHPALAFVPIVPFLPHEPRRLTLFGGPARRQSQSAP